MNIPIALGFWNIPLLGVKNLDIYQPIIAIDWPYFVIFPEATLNRPGKNARYPLVNVYITENTHRNS
jgi:hypothetical protein